MKSMVSPSLILHLSLSFSSNAVVKIIWNNKWDYPVQRISRCQRQVSAVVVVLIILCQLLSKIRDIVLVNKRKNFLFILQIPA